MDAPSEGSAPAAGVGFLADPSYHRVRVQHIGQLVAHASSLIAQVEGSVADGKPITLADGHTTLPIMALDRIANLLRHAAEEITDERMACVGWPQV